MNHYPPSRKPNSESSGLPQHQPRLFFEFRHSSPWPSFKAAKFNPISTKSSAYPIPQLFFDKHFHLPYTPTFSLTPPRPPIYRPFSNTPVSPYDTPPNIRGLALGKSRRRTAYPQQIVTTRLLYCLQDRFAQLSRLQRI